MHYAVQIIALDALISRSSNPLFMLEIEVKVPCADLIELEKKLKDMGARDFGRSMQKDVYYAHPARDFGETDEALRLRIDNDLQIITYKGPKLDDQSKTREEIEISISSAERMALVLERLGFKPVLSVSKTRRIYGLRGISVCLDSVKGLGDFVEFEYEGGSMEEGKQAIFLLMKDLNISGNERRSYLELLLEKRAKSK